MLSKAHKGDRGANIKPSARRSIHADCVNCNINEIMGRYGCHTHRKNNRSKACNSEINRGADEVDNVMSKFKQPDTNNRPLEIGKSLSRRNSIDVPGNDSGGADSSGSDDDILSKSLPATFSSYFSNDELYSSATQNNYSNSRNGSQLFINDSKNSPSQVRSNTIVRNIDFSQFQTIERPSDNYTFSSGMTLESAKYAHETTRNGGNIFKYIGIILVIAAVAMGVNSDYFLTDTVNNIIFSKEIVFNDDIKSLGAKYKVNSDTLLQLKSGISTILKNQDAASFMFIYNSQASSFNPKVFYNFVDELALKTVKYLRNYSDSIQNVIVDPEQIETDLELMNLKNEVDKTGVMIVPNINNIPSELAMAFHYYCDEYSPLVKSSAIFFTLDAAKCLNNAKVTHQHVENCLMKKWNDIHKDKIGPLLTRVVNIIIDVTNIF